MKLHAMKTGLALAVLVGMGLSGPAAADVQVPFQGSLEGSTDVSQFPSAVTVATGKASQLGLFTYTWSHIVTPPTASGTFEFVAANGDTIFGTGVGNSAPSGTPNVLSIVETMTITGGTGRFAGATGAFTVTRLYNTATLVTIGSLEGTLSAPGAGG